MAADTPRCPYKWQLALKKVCGLATFEGLDVSRRGNSVVDLEFLMQIFCREMPKCEFHAHLSGSISGKTLRTVLLKRECGYTAAKEAKLREATRTPRNLNEALQIFPLIHEMVVRPEEVHEVTLDVIQEFNLENVVYLELRSTPRRTAYMSTEDYVKALVSGVIHAKRICPNICVRVLLSIDRRQTIEQAAETINLALKYRFIEDGSHEGVVIGVDISGDPRYDARKFLPLLEKVKEYLPVISIQLGETPNNLDEVAECLHFEPTRIGHATYIHAIPSYSIKKMCLDYIRNNKIPIEICLGSNMTCGSVQSVVNSHFTYYYGEKHPVLISTGNREMMCSSLTDEYTRIAYALDLDPEDVFRLSLTATNYISNCLKPEERARLMDRFYQFAAQIGMWVEYP